MKTILAIDDDVLVAAMTLAQADHRDLGEVISALARRSLRDQPTSGIPLLPTLSEAACLSSL